jgi:hypothetical protein
MSNHDCIPLTPLRSDPSPENENLRIGSQLLRGVPPLQASSAKRHRVWLALPHTGRRRRWWKPATLVLTSALAGAAASAALGGAYLRARDTADASEHEVSSQPAGSRDTGQQQVENPVPPEPQSVEEPAPQIEQARPVSERKAPPRKTEQTAPEPVKAAEAELMLEIMSARERGDQKRAAQLLSEYRSEHPRGILEEEALALSIESAQMKGDPRAAALAREYLKRFPTGRFRAQAARVVRGTSR